jgi:hypothetical protein
MRSSGDIGYCFLWAGGKLKKGASGEGVLFARACRDSELEQQPELGLPDRNALVYKIMPGVDAEVIFAAILGVASLPTFSDKVGK